MSTPEKYLNGEAKMYHCKKAKGKRSALQCSVCIYDNKCWRDEQ